MKNILIIGSLNMDIVIQTDRVPVMGETITGKGFNTFPGGKGANQAVACGRLGAGVKMLGSVGQDTYGDALLSNLAKNGVDADGIARAPVSTGIAMITVCKGENVIILEPGANQWVTRELIDKHIAELDWADYVIMQYEIPLETVIYAAEIAKKRGKTVVVNPAPMKETPPELLENIDIFVPNETEAELFLGEKITNPEAAARKIRDISGAKVIITLGKQGCVFFDGDTAKMVPPIDIQVVDTTAAGDSFIGGLVTAMSNGFSFEESIRYATKAATITVSRMGAQASLPYKHEI